MNIKNKYLIIPLIVALLFGGRNNEYSNELKMINIIDKTSISFLQNEGLDSQSRLNF